VALQNDPTAYERNLQMLGHQIRNRLAAALVLLAAGASAAAPPTAAAKTKLWPPPRHHSHRSGIPQHGGGDHDADNNGAPSDGDGNV
jgi:hypothetical protein